MIAISAPYYVVSADNDYLAIQIIKCHYRITRKLTSCAKVQAKGLFTLLTHARQ